MMIRPGIFYKYPGIFCADNGQKSLTACKAGYQSNKNEMERKNGREKHLQRRDIK